MRRRTKLLLLSFLFLFLFLVFTLVVKKGAFKQFDFDWTVKTQNHLSRRIDGILSLFSFLASFEVIAILLIISLLFRKKVAGIFVFLSFVGAHLVEIVGKALFDHPGPPFLFQRTAIGIDLPSSYVESKGSYPSGHALRSVFVGLIIINLILNSKKISRNRKWLFSILALGFPIVVIIAKVVFGQHWLTDIIAGVLLGASSSFFSLIFI